MNTLVISNGSIESAAEIMAELAKWFEQTNKNVWNINKLTSESLSRDLNPDNFYTMKINRDNAAAMILQWHDPVFWPDIVREHHKLCKLYERMGFKNFGICTVKMKHYELYEIKIN